MFNFFKRDAPEPPDDPPIVKLVNRIIEDAYSRGATQVRIEVQENSARVTYTVKGEDEERMRLPVQAHGNVVNRIKVMAELRHEKHLEQEGSFEFLQFGRKGLDIPIGVEITPSGAGERIVLKLGKPEG